MKSINFIVAAVMCVLSLNGFAQSTMRIEFKEGKLMDIPVSSVASIKWFTNGTTPTTPDISPSGAQAVDLGLSVKWANMNIGATSPEDYGDYFAWGETVGYNGGKRTFKESTYKYYTSTTKIGNDGFGVDIKGYTKYVTKSDASKHGYDGFYDDKTVLDPEDDAAIANWGGSWRMPTKEEIDELCSKCTWVWTSLMGKVGCKVTGPNGNFVFFPTAGDIEGSYKIVDTRGFFLSKSLNTSESDECVFLFIGSKEICRSAYRREYGRPVRAVCK